MTHVLVPQTILGDNEPDSTHCHRKIAPIATGSFYLAHFLHGIGHREDVRWLYDTRNVRCTRQI